MKRQLPFDMNAFGAFGFNNTSSSSPPASCSAAAAAAASSMASLAAACSSSINLNRNMSINPTRNGITTASDAAANHHNNHNGLASSSSSSSSGAVPASPSSRTGLRDEAMPSASSSPSTSHDQAGGDHNTNTNANNNNNNAEGERLFQELGAALELAFQRNQYPQPLSEVAIGPIQAICDKLFPKHLRLEVPKIAQTLKKHDPEELVKYVHIWTDDDCNVCVFVLPPGAKIPMHNHPNMSVVSRLLYGNLHVKSYDLVAVEGDNIVVNNNPQPSNSQRDSNKPRRHLARVLADTWVRAPFTTHLLPDRGNIHEFVSGDDIGCAIFDILTPPYDASQGRECTYYRLVDRLETRKNGQVLVELEECDAGDYYVDPLDYLGPSLFEDQLLSDDGEEEDEREEPRQEEEEEDEYEEEGLRSIATGTGIMYPRTQKRQRTQE